MRKGRRFPLFTLVAPLNHNHEGRLDGRIPRREALRDHVEDPREEHEARGVREEAPLRPGFQLPDSPQGPAGQSTRRRCRIGCRPSSGRGRRPWARSGAGMWARPGVEGGRGRTRTRTRTRPRALIPEGVDAWRSSARRDVRRRQRLIRKFRLQSRRCVLNVSERVL